MFWRLTLSWCFDGDRETLAAVAGYQVHRWLVSISHDSRPWLMNSLATQSLMFIVAHAHMPLLVALKCVPCFAVHDDIAVCILNFRVRVFDIFLVDPLVVCDLNCPSGD
jgi:hypothetical protein